MITTARLRIVSPNVDEVVDIGAGRREGHEWAPDYPTAGDVVMARRVLASGEFPTAQQPWGPLQIILSDTGLAIGGIGFKGCPDPDGVAEIGYGLAPSVQGNGLATEAMLGMVDLARRLGLRVLKAETDADNVASQRVLEKAGFARSHSETTDPLVWRMNLVE